MSDIELRAAEAFRSLPSYRGTEKDIFIKAFCMGAHSFYSEDNWIIVTKGSARVFEKQADRIKKLESAMKTLDVLTYRSPEWKKIIRKALEE
jgi:hypothetical protein